MRNKLKQLMNKEEGFTLVELLAVIVILGLIIAIAIPAVGSIVDNARGNTEEATETLIIDAARLYDVENEIAEGTGNGVSVSDLITKGFLELRNDETISGRVDKVTTGGNTTYTFVPGS